MSCLGAPSATGINTDLDGYVWQTLQEPPQVPYPPTTLDAPNHRISLLYQNIIFDFQDPHPHPDHVLRSQKDNDADDRPDGTTFLTQHPTPAANTTGASFLLPSGSLKEPMRPRKQAP
ncbi:hypothetical protein OG21DRAFT_1490341 [Imleria badia]|nr:hypothetical protein OG21DRAFT_1490341 [Imleria badia]